MIEAVLYIESFLLSFLQVSILGVILLTQAIHIRLDLWLVQVAQGLVHFHKLKFIGLNVRRRLPFTAKRVIVLSQANILLASIYISLK